MARDHSGSIIGDDCTLLASFLLLVFDSERDGFTLLSIARLSSNQNIIDYFVDKGLKNPTIASQIKRSTKIESRREGDVVKEHWEIQGLYGKVRLNMVFRRQTPYYNPANDLSHYQDNYVGLRFLSAPNQLVEISRRSTHYDADLQNVNLSFDLEDPLLSEVFDDKDNVINWVREDIQEILLERII